jgi:hypothetical protein
VSPVRYELASYIPEDDILHSCRRDDFKSDTISNYFEIQSRANLITMKNSRSYVCNFVVLVRYFK